MKVPRFNFFPVKEYHASPEAYAEATRLIEKATKEVDAYHARLAAAEAVCRAAEEFNNWLEKTELSANGKEIKIVKLGTHREALRPKINESVKQFKQALAAWEAACKS